jgi:hypothetical protein
MAKEILEKLAKAIDAERFENYYLDKIIELIYDSDITVKISALKLIFNIFEKLTPHTRETRVISIFMEHLMNTNEEV